MGAACCGSSPPEPTVESHVDKVVKYVISPILIVLGFVALVILFLVEKVSCYPRGSSVDQRNPKAEELCWSEFKNATFDGKNWDNNEFLPHKIFPILIICEGLSLLLPLIIWYWCFGRDLSDHVTSLIDHSNNLTEYYRKYDRLTGRAVTESMLHRELDNFLEYLAYLLISQSKRMFRLYVAKWVALLLFTVAWILGLVLLHIPDMVIFPDTFICVYDRLGGKQKLADCTVHTATLLRATWYVDIIMLSFLVIFGLIFVIVLFKPMSYTDTFMYTSIPGCMDCRLASCIQEFFNPRYFTFFSRFCTQNTQVCRDVGLSRSLARKYGLFHHHIPGRGGIMDKHFPIIQPEQLEKFRLSAELAQQGNNLEGESLSDDKQTSKDQGAAANMKTSNRVQGKIVKTMPKKAGVHKYSTVDDGVTPTPRTSTRQEKNLPETRPSYSKTPNQLPDSSRNSNNSTLENGGFTISISSTSSRRSPKLRNKRPVPWSRNFYGYQHGLRFGKIHPQTTDRYPRFVMRHRELDPYTFRMRRDMMRMKAQNVFRWVP